MGERSDPKEGVGDDAGNNLFHMRNKEMYLEELSSLRRAGLGFQAGR